MESGAVSHESIALFCDPGFRHSDTKACNISNTPSLMCVCLAGMAMPSLPDAARMSLLPMYMPTEPETSETPPTGCAQVCLPSCVCSFVPPAWMSCHAVAELGCVDCRKDLTDVCVLSVLPKRIQLPLNACNQHTPAAMQTHLPVENDCVSVS